MVVGITKYYLYTVFGILYGITDETYAKLHTSRITSAVQSYC